MQIKVRSGLSRSALIFGVALSRVTGETVCLVHIAMHMYLGNLEGCFIALLVGV